MEGFHIRKRSFLSLNKNEKKMFKKIVLVLNNPKLKDFSKLNEQFNEQRKSDLGHRVLYTLNFHDKLVGFIEIVLYKEYIVLDYFYIKKIFRKIGAGTFFLKELKEMYPSIVLCILKENKNYFILKNFYIKNNFKEIEKPKEIIGSSNFNEVYFKFENDLT